MNTLGYKECQDAVSVWTQNKGDLVICEKNNKSYSRF